MNATRILTLVLAAVASQLLPPTRTTFYQGKTLSLVVGYSAGGGYDINARLVSRHIGRHIPGTPNCRVVNMPGAGSLRSVEHLERHAPKDGTVVNMFDYTQITNSLLTPDKVRSISASSNGSAASRRIWRSVTSGIRSMRGRSRTCSACRKSIWAAPILERPPTRNSGSCESCLTSTSSRSPVTPAARRPSSRSSAANLRAAA
jgi:hypothetical protein